jgi:aspartyl-tRNA(Asn)/glutamyl-tRNA(Gln) amidotransferase subunit A
MTELHWLTATEISAAYASHTLSPVELVTGLLERIAREETALNAFIRVDADIAIDAAKLAEKEINAGRVVGPLHGVPVGIKDIIDIAGLPTTCHSKIRLDHVATADAAVVSRLRSAGAIFLGKMALHEFAIGGPAHDLPFPPARNPWNREHHPGGSSSGCGSALASGMLPVALGTDTGGSIRNPAGHCGIVGLKPTYDLVPRHGVFPLSVTLDHVGPMARSIEDLAQLMDAIASPRLRLHQPRFGIDLNRGVRGLKIGMVRQFHEADLVASPEVAAAFDHVVQVLRNEGAIVSDISLPRLQEFSAVQRVIFHSESWSVHDKWLAERPADYAGISRRKLMPGAFLPAGLYVQAHAQRRRLISRVDDAFRDVDIMLAANSLDPACEMDDDEACTLTYSRHARSPFNLTGHPALAVMAGLSGTGLPLSVQFIGRQYDEITLLRAGAAYERATHTAQQHPPLRPLKQKMAEHS